MEIKCFVNVKNVNVRRYTYLFFVANEADTQCKMPFHTGYGSLKYMM